MSIVARSLRAAARTRATAAGSKLAEASSRQGRRTFSAAAAGHSDEDLARDVATWRRVTAFAAVFCAGFAVYTLYGASAHHSHKDKPAYEYLHVRNKEFPWGPCGLFELDCKRSLKEQQ
ncbi:hypothetical protein CBR_g50891 [Chara braunii]|uniref:Uncharacterized protein n=1 Tax=Chara braunii TaxID=69332 RepID=A0A388M7I6_CHABU|nr:hypothetical protein CBR_g50891 [Chara braunii]|eukprot:GBG90548.1 hypothetical protein CBR_g50891 [Chara braunii]